MKIIKCKECGKVANIFNRLFYQKDYVIETGTVYNCPKCYKKIKKMWKE